MQPTLKKPHLRSQEMAKHFRDHFQKDGVLKSIAVLQILWVYRQKPPALDKGIREMIVFLIVPISSRLSALI